MGRLRHIEEQAAAIIVTALCIVGLLGCGASPSVPVVADAPTAGCPDRSVSKKRVLSHEAYAWCEDTDGVALGSFKVSYPDGRPKLYFSLKAGRVHGVYRAFHPSGRRAIEQTFQDGAAVGPGVYWPPNGPALRCAPSDCVDRDLTLGRPFCSPTQISEVLASHQAGLDLCASASMSGEPGAGTITAQWWIGLLGHPYAVQVRSSETDRPTAECITDLIKGMHFEAPFGETCSVRMPFNLKGH